MGYVYFLKKQPHSTVQWMNVMQEKTLFKLLGKRIVELRKERNLTQEQLGDLCDMERASIARLEGGTENITASTFLKLSKALNVPLKEFFDFED